MDPRGRVYSLTLVLVASTREGHRSRPRDQTAHPYPVEDGRVREYVDDDPKGQGGVFPLRFRLRSNLLVPPLRP